MPSGRNNNRAGAPGPLARCETANLHYHWEMDSSFLLLSRLPNWTGRDTELAPGLGIRRLNQWEREAVDSGEQDGYWLCHEFDNPHPPEIGRHKKRREAAFRLMLHAVYAVQVLVPCGSPGVFLLYRKNAGGWSLEATERRQPFLPTEWGRRCWVPAAFAVDAPVMLERVLEAFYKPVIQLQIPIWLLEQGMAAPDQHIRILLCATGLDSLTKASGQAVFKERLCDLLGADTLIFPPDATGRQPRYRVGDVAGHLYQLRNEMAHGLPFQAIFHKKLGFLDDAGEPLAREYAKYRYDKVLEECAVFLLCRALREVLLSRMAFDVHMMEWRGPGPS
jgi:hypothetical protein